MSLTHASQQRIDRFVSAFVRSEYVAMWSAEKDADYINEPDRAARCADAAEDGADGKTHAEVIEDFREAFNACLRQRKSQGQVDRVDAAVSEHFDSIEAWHATNGSLNEVIG